jgi:AcrR family transcriptional regulator
MKTRAPPPRHRARAIERTREDIVEAAARVFAEAGFHAATMQAIAREAGFTAASLYTYFSSKEEIHRALLAEMERAILAILDAPVPAGLSLQQRLELLLQRQLALVASRSAALRVALDLPNRAGQDGHRKFIAPLARFLAADGGAAQLRCPPEEAARLLFAMVHSVVLPWFLGAEKPEVSRNAARLADLFLNGFGRPDSTR